MLRIVEGLFQGVRAWVVGQTVAAEAAVEYF